MHIGTSRCTYLYFVFDLAIGTDLKGWDFCSLWNVCLNTVPTRICETDGTSSSSAASGGSGGGRRGEVDGANVDEVGGEGRWSLAR